MLKAPEFELDPAEAKMLAENMTNVASQYSVEVNPKYMAWIALTGCLLAIYGPRFGAIFVKRAVQPAKPQVVKEAPQGNVVTPVVEQWTPPTQFQNV